MKLIKKIFSKIVNDKQYAIGVPPCFVGITSDITCVIHCTGYTGFCTIGGGLVGALLGWGAYNLYHSCARERIEISDLESDTQPPSCVSFS